MMNSVFSLFRQVNYTSAFQNVVKGYADSESVLTTQPIRDYALYYEYKNLPRFNKERPMALDSTPNDNGGNIFTICYFDIPLIIKD